MGPVVGGAVVDGLDWQWIFWVNVPVGIVAVPLIFFVLRESSLENVKLDLPGMLLAAAALFAVVWGIVHASEDGWTSATVLAAFAAGAGLLALFLLWERRTAQPMLPLSFYRVRAFTLTNIVSASMYFGVFGSLFLLAQYLQIAPPRTPLEAGVRTLAWTLMPMFVAPVAGMLTSKVGGGRLMALGLFLQGVGLAWINLIAGTDTSYTALAGPMVVAGVGMGFVFAPTAAVVLGSVSDEHAGKASGANTTVREVGGALGIAVLSTVFASHGSTASPSAFVDGMHPAVWVGVGVVLAGALCALGIPRGPQPADTQGTEPETAATDADRTAAATA
jgi:MFS family permease